MTPRALLVGKRAIRWRFLRARALVARSLRARCALVARSLRVPDSIAALLCILSDDGRARSSPTARTEFFFKHVAAFLFVWLR